MSSTRRALMQSDVEAHRGARRASRSTAAAIGTSVPIISSNITSSVISERKRPASDQKLDVSSEKGRPLPTEGEKDSSKAPVTVPVEVLDTMLQFVDGNGLLSCERVSYRWRLATDRTSLWKQACLSAFPHLGDHHFESAYASCSAYEGDWREVFLDGNRESRSTVLDWKMEAVGRGNGADALVDGDTDESERRYFSPFSLCGYSFSLIADPGGNPRAANQAQAAGAPRVEKGLSVYLTVEFQNGLPDTPLWGGGFLSHPAFPPPPLQVGPGHPWLLAGEGSTTGGGGNISVDEGSGGGGGGGEGGDGGDVEEGVLVAGRSEGREVKRDPHGLRRRRRRCRTREGRTKMVSHVRDPSVIERGCCAAFSLSAVNEAGLKDVMWVSSMDDDRFFPGRSSWGVHCLLPTSRIQDPEAGFLKNGGLTVRLRLRLLFLTAHVYTTADLASHRGFGVVPVRGNDQPYHYRGYGEVKGRSGRRENHRNMPWNAGLSQWGWPGASKTVGPLPCLTFEVMRCTTVEEMEKLVAVALDVPSTNDIRLWVITQPLTDAPLAPRQLLSEEGRTARLLDGARDSPSLVRLLTSDTMDDTCRVRLWVEQRSDGGFWEMEREPPRWQAPAKPDHSCGAAAAVALAVVTPQPPTTSTPTSSPAPKAKFAGVRLSCTADMHSWEMRSALGWGPRAWSPPVAPGPPEETAGAGATVPPPGNANDAAAVAAVPGGGGGEHPEVAPAVGSVQGGAGGGGGLSPTIPPREERILVFLKTLGLGGGGGGAVGSGRRGGAREEGGGCSGGGGDASGGGGRGGEGWPIYLTHAVLRRRSPLRSLFELAAELLPEGVAPEELGAYVEELPCVWQRVSTDTVGPEAAPSGSQDEGKGKGSTRGSNSSSSSAPQSSRDCPPQAPPPSAKAERVAKGCSGVSVSKRFFSCPPPSSLPLPSGHRPKRHGARPWTRACGGSGGGSSSSDGAVSVSSSVQPKHAPPPPAAAAAATAATVRGAAAAGSSVVVSSAAVMAASAAPELPASCSASMSPAARAGGRGEFTENFDDDNDGGGEEALENRPITLKEAGIEPGASICFFRSGCGGRGMASVGRTYAEIAEELVQGMRELLQGRGPLGRVHLLKLPEVVEVCESLGYQGFRARIAHEQQQHVNARQTLEYVARGRHLAFICDSCGMQDFSGPRYHCLSCPDYDLCLKCNDKPEPVPQHRYLFAEGHWKREGGFRGHSDAHELEEILTVPSRGFDWRV